MDEKNVLMGILAIILGIVVIAFPYVSIFTFSVMAGFGILMLGIWFLIQTFDVWEDSKAASIVYLILGLIAIVAGIGMMGNLQAFSALASILIYLAGFWMLFGGTLALFTGITTNERGIGALGVILGVTYLIVGIYAFNPYYLALLIGIWLIFDGIRLFFVKSPEEEIEEIVSELEEDLAKESEETSEKQS
jgi:uncharacterized membrane protein HdeD (DUF308 family)